MVATGIAVLGKMPARQEFILHRNMARLALTVMLRHMAWSLLRYLP